MIRPIAIYLPQFHPVPENDEWWGKGFTEWTNVTKAKPLFEGHYQPHLPSDLGFYDLRLHEARQAQADLAREYGIYGFCYYHYWFNGRRILERPFQAVFESGKPDFPFMLCWANENWTRTWDGGEKHVLLEQKYSAEDDLMHIRALIPYFKDKRYIRINNKPVFAIYRSGLFPSIRQTIKIWREEAAKHGLELYLCRFESFGVTGEKHMEAGFDAAIEFAPPLHAVHEPDFTPPLKTLKEEFSLENVQKSIRFRLRRMFGIKEKSKVPGTVTSYSYYVNYASKQFLKKNSYKLYRTICPGWDNSSRRKENFFVLKDSTPALFELLASRAVESFEPFSDEENLLFINAWNEWAEGNHLEPCIKWGRQYLQTLKNVFEPKLKEKEVTVNV